MGGRLGRLKQVTKVALEGRLSALVPAFYGWMTGHEFLEFTGSLYGLSIDTAKTRAVDLLEKVNLSEAAGKWVKEYSRGMQQRLGLA